MTASTPNTPPTTLLGKVGTVAMTAVKHVPTRMVLWGVVGFLVGVIGVVFSYLIGIWLLAEGAIGLAYLDGGRRPRGCCGGDVGLADGL